MHHVVELTFHQLGLHLVGGGLVLLHGAHTHPVSDAVDVLARVQPTLAHRVEKLAIHIVSKSASEIQE